MTHIGSNVGSVSFMKRSLEDSVNRKRSCADTLDSVGRHDLAADLTTYVLTFADKPQELWQFHSYGNSTDDDETEMTDKMSPQIDDILETMSCFSCC